MHARTARNGKGRPTVLVTGFGPFPGVGHNVSGDLAPALAASATKSFSRYRFVPAVLPVDWRQTPRALAALLARHRPAVALHFGVARSATGFRLETQAHNACRTAEDAAGRLPLEAALSPAGVDVRVATLPVVAIATRLAAEGLPVTVSENAGGYLCNAVLYQALSYASAAETACRIGFVHIPTDLSGPPLDFEQALFGGLTIVRCAIESIQPQII